MGLRSRTHSLVSAADPVVETLTGRDERSSLGLCRSVERFAGPTATVLTQSLVGPDSAPVEASSPNSRLSAFHQTTVFHDPTVRTVLTIDLGLGHEARRPAHPHGAVHVSVRPKSIRSDSIEVDTPVCIGWTMRE